MRIGPNIQICILKPSGLLSTYTEAGLNIISKSLWCTPEQNSYRKNTWNVLNRKLLELGILGAKSTFSNIRILILVPALMMPIQALYLTFSSPVVAQLAILQRIVHSLTNHLGGFFLNFFFSSSLTDSLCIFISSVVVVLSPGIFLLTYYLFASSLNICGLSSLPPTSAW